MPGSASFISDLEGSNAGNTTCLEEEENQPPRDLTGISTYRSLKNLTCLQVFGCVIGLRAKERTTVWVESDCLFICWLVLIECVLSALQDTVWKTCA